MKQPLKHVFVKEFIDTIRDKRTMLTMIVIPVLIFPVILTLFTTISQSFTKEAMEKELKIGIAEADIDNPIVEYIENAPMGNMSIVKMKDTTEFTQSIRDDSIQIGLSFDQDFISNYTGEKTGHFRIYINSTDITMKQRIDGVFDQYQDLWRQDRMQRLDIDPESIEPVTYSYQDIASSEEKIGKLAGGILPYIFIAFCFIGCMYPAIDLFTGEKERGTIETILSTPVKRWQLLFGKMAVVVLSGLLAATLALVGLFVAIEFMDLVENEKILEVVRGILSFKFIALLYALLIPLTIFFAGLMIPVAVYAKSFKEAQSIITPLNFLVVVPAIAGFFPGVELNMTTAFIPIVNVVLATKDIIAGTIDPLLLAICFFSLVLLAFIAVFVSHRQYGKESNVVM